MNAGEVGEPGQLTIGVVIPLYNEGEGLELFHTHLASCLKDLPQAFTICYVNDGSTDRTADVLAAIAAKDPRVAVIELSRNFGHQSALTAGLDATDADATITMDGDGQHPAEMIGEMIAAFIQGFDIVLMQRREDGRASAFKRLTSGAFYRSLNLIADTRLTPGAADFRLLSRRVVEGLRELPEHHRFLRGMIAWMGFRTAILPYSPQERILGRSKYSLRKMVRLAMDATFSFSLVPLYLGVLLGILFLGLGLAEAIYVVSLWLGGRYESLAPGWSSLMFMLLIVGGTLATILGILGVYVGYIFQEVKRRPAYFIRGRIAPGAGEVRE
jgi:dolichol-phosphate mannosyltransferase